MFGFVTNFFANFSMGEQIMAIFLCVAFVLVLLLRIILVSSYNGGLALINRASKGVKTKGDVEKLTGGTFARAAKEYAAMVSGGARTDALDVARMAVTKNRLYFFNFKSLAGLIRLIERAFLPFAILFTLAASAQIEFVILSAVVFLLIIIFAAIFDVDAAQDRYVTNLAYILARDIGRLYPPDAATAVYTFGTDLNEYLNRQSAMYNEVLNKIKTEFAGAITANIQAMAKSVDATLNSIAKHDALDEAIGRWASVVDKSAEMQSGVVGASEKFGAAAAAMATYSATMQKNREEMKEDIVLLTNAIQKLNQLAAAMEVRNTALDGEVGLVLENQKTLETAVASYELSLKEITSQMGDAMGKIMDYHLGKSGGRIADNIADSVKQALSGARIQEEHIKSILEEFLEQNRYQTKLLLEMKAQIGDADEYK
ncbi:MAG: hypothetical protein FWC76_00510 [Defluviitaleaceae bacterium]|nr:hypothetical protein [Defluviitaleaceae bacterium]